MKLTSILAIYMLFWVMSAFMLLPVGVKTPQETGEALVPGQADSAPGNFRPKRIAIRATILSAVLFALYYANYVNGWVKIESLDITRWMRR